MNGNRILFWKLVEPEHPIIRAFCRKLAGNREDGDDLYQDALVTALKKFESLRENGSFRPWLYRIVINTFKNQTRQPWWRRLVSLTPAVEEQPLIDDLSASIAARRRLEYAFKALSPDDRVLVTLFELEGWSVAELAELTGKSVANVKIRLMRARRKMRDRLVRFFQQSATQELTQLYASEEGLCAVTKPGKK
jgi:RNA polymerase sigma-70 factor (ECF subfamily)